MSSNNSRDNFIIVIRSSDERTFEICRKLLELQALPGTVTYVNLSPFKTALEECYRIAINSEKKWLITADADMLVLPDSIDLLVQHAEQMPDDYLQLQGKIFDKITGTIRKAGPRIYRIKYLPQVLEYSINSKDNIRPEGSLVTALGKQGMPSRYLSSVTAYHDFEQYYRDLYRKAFVHANKHRGLAGQLIQRCIENREYDTDYKVILRAVMDGLEESGVVSIDTNMFRQKSKKAIELLGIDEKEPFGDTVNPKEVLTSIQKKQPLNNTGPVYFSDQPPTNKKYIDSFLKILKRDGFLRGSLHSLGVLLERIGRKMKLHQ